MNHLRNKLNQYKETGKNEIKETKLLIKILYGVIKNYIKTKKIELDDEDKNFIKNQSIDIAKLIPLVVMQVIPGSTLATPFIIELGKKLGIKLKSETPSKYSESELQELVNADGTFINKNIPLLQQNTYPKKTTDQTVAMGRQAINTLTQGYRRYYGESHNNEKPLTEVDYSDVFGWDEVKNAKNYKQAKEILQKMGIEDPVELDSRLSEFGFEPEYDNNVRRLSEIEINNMIDEIILTKKNNDDDIVKKNSDLDTDKPIVNVLIRNVKAIKKIAEKENININKIIKILKTGE